MRAAAVLTSCIPFWLLAARLGGVNFTVCLAPAGYFSALSAAGWLSFGLTTAGGKSFSTKLFTPIVTMLFTVSCVGLPAFSYLADEFGPGQNPVVRAAPASALKMLLASGISDWCSWFWPIFLALAALACFVASKLSKIRQVIHRSYS